MVTSSITKSSLFSYDSLFRVEIPEFEYLEYIGGDRTVNFCLFIKISIQCYMIKSIL